MNKDTENDRDQVQRFVFEKNAIRGEIINLEQSYQEATSTQDLHPVAQQLLGEFLAAVTLLSGTLKFDGIISLQARGDGPIPLAMAECTHQKEIRGIVRTGEVSLDGLSSENFPALIGKGVLAITIEPERGQRYQGLVPLEGATLAACIEDYFMQSEQLPTRVWLASGESNCGGLLLQMMPALADAEGEHSDHWELVTHLASTVKKEELLGVAPETLLYRLFHEAPVRVFEPTPVQFACSCSRERSANALRSLGREDVEELVAERDIITVDCQFCGQVYSFGEKDVADLFGDDPEQVH